MKKIGIFLLILIIAVSCVFARSTFSGKARLRFGVWQQNDGSFNYGFIDKSDVSGTFMINEFIGSSTGEGKLFGEVNFGGQIRAKLKGEQIFNNWGPLGDTLQYRLFFNYANLVFNKATNFKLSINGQFAQPRYAKGWEIEVDNGNTIGTTPFLTMTTALENSTMLFRAQGGWIPGVSLSYGPFKVSFALDGGSATNLYLSDYYKTVGGKTLNTNVNPGVMLLGEMNDFRLIDTDDSVLALSVSAGYLQSHNMYMFDYDSSTDTAIPVLLECQQHILAGVGLKYETDLLSLLVGANANIALNDNPYTPEALLWTLDNQKYSLEGSVNFKLHGAIPLTFDAWYLDNQGLWANENEPDWVTYGNQADLGYVYRMYNGDLLHSYTGSGDSEDKNANNTLLHQALSAKFTITPLDLLGVEVNAQDLLNQVILGLRVPLHLTDAFTLTPGFEYTDSTNRQYVHAENKWSTLARADKNSIYEAYLGFNFKHTLFNLFAYVRAGSETKGTKQDGAGGAFYIRPYLSLTSTSLIDNVKLEFRWQAATFGNTTTAPSGKYHTLTSNAGQRIGEIYVEARINF